MPSQAELLPGITRAGSLIIAGAALGFTAVKISGPPLSVDSGRQAEPFSQFSQDLAESLMRKRERARYARQGWKLSACAASGRLHFGCCGAGARAEITALAETHSGRDRAKAHECRHHFEPGAGRHQRAHLNFLDAPVFKTKAD